jgi:hypothetical protein
MKSVYNKVRYSEFRGTLQELNVGKWFVYHRGNLAVARRSNREIELIARLTYGLSLSGAAILMQKRDEQGVIEYRLYPTRKLKLEDFEEASALNPPLSKEAREYMAGNVQAQPEKGDAEEA